MPGHDQTRLEQAHVGIIGCGGLGGWTALALARMGVSHLTLIDEDTFDRTNAPRQLMFGRDLGQSKASALARNIQPHMLNAGAVCAIPRHFSADDAGALAAVDALFVGVDNNRARIVAAQLGRRREIPVVFAMLSRDGLRAQVLLQKTDGPCLSCLLPNLDVEAAMPCAAASIASCFLAAAHAVHLLASALMNTDAPTWWEASLDGSREHVGRPVKRKDCTCATSRGIG